jgi:GTP pyrophosphokinase
VDGSEKVLEPTLKALKQASLDDLYIAVATGSLGAKDVVVAAYPELKQAPRAPRHAMPLPQRPRNTGYAGPDLPISGLVAGMAIHYAGCCHPLAGDRIVGIVTTGKGVTIHTRECPTLESFAATPERFIDVGWEPSAFTRVAGKGEGHTGRISVIASNEGNVLAVVTNAIAKQDGAVANLRIVNRQADFFEIVIDVEVRDLAHLSRVIAGLRASSGVHQVERAKG